MTVQILTGDVFTVLDTLPSESVHCVVTSPPYWGLRDYGVDGQLGMESSLPDHIAVMVKVFREVRRVLRKDGTVWLNYGDCYASSPNGKSAAQTKADGNDDRTFRDKPFSTIGGYLKAKDLAMMPNRIAIALQEDGWWVRSEIIWNKPNPMPESIKDRPGCAHEKIWLLAKSRRYYYDAEAVMVATEIATRKRLDQNIAQQTGSFRQPGKTNGPFKAVGRKDKRHLRNVWTVSPKGFRGAHFATFPTELIEPCIKAGCPVGGVVLDPFGGSGTVGVVCQSLNRNAILIEINPDYVTIARARVAGVSVEEISEKQSLYGRTRSGFNARWKRQEAARRIFD